MRFNQADKVRAPATLNRYMKRHLDAENVIAERVRDCQKRSGMSDRQLAAATGIPANEIRRIKRTGELTLQKANRLAHAFGPDVCTQGIQSLIGPVNRWGFLSAYREG